MSEPMDETADETAPESSDDFAKARRERAQTETQEALDAFEREGLGVDYRGNIVPRAQAIYMRLLIERGLITEDEAVSAQLEIQTSLLKEELKADLLARDEAALRKAQDAGRDAGRVRPFRGPRLIVPGGKGRG